MPYGHTASAGTTLAATGLATDYFWLVLGGLAVVVTGALVVRLTFRRGRGPVEA